MYLVGKGGGWGPKAEANEMNPSLRTSWWYCRAKEAKRQARLETRPPKTAVRRMDFRLQ